MQDSEKQFAAFLTKCGKSWKAQPKTFRSGEFVYRPDFYCYDDNIYYEVKTDSGGIDKVITLRMLFPEIKIKIVNPDGSMFHGRGSEIYLAHLQRAATLYLTKDSTEFTKAEVAYLEKHGPKIWGATRPRRYMFNHYYQKARIKSEQGRTTC